MLATDLFGFGAKVETARALATIARTNSAPLRDVTWSDWTRRIAPREEVRAALGALARVTTYAHAPERASAGETIAQIKMGLDPGVRYLDGGWQTLVDGLEQSARDAGARILPGAPVATITRGGGRGFSVALRSGETLEAHAVIVATGPATARTLLGVPALGADLVPLRTACLDVGLSALPYPDRTFALGIDRPTYFSVHSASARLAEAGATLHVMKYLDPDETHDPRDDERELEGVLDLMQPGWRDRVVAKRFLPNLVATNALVAAGARRPNVDAAGIAGAFVAGDWVGGEGMLADTALASAKRAAELAIAEATRIVPRQARREDTMAAP
jgi:phytoene dehydrogenase-like protein